VTSPWSGKEHLTAWAVARNRTFKWFHDFQGIGDKLDWNGRIDLTLPKAEQDAEIQLAHISEFFAIFGNFEALPPSI
jgi:hypothetical protein